MLESDSQSNILQITLKARHQSGSRLPVYLKAASPQVNWLERVGCLNVRETPEDSSAT